MPEQEALQQRKDRWGLRRLFGAAFLADFQLYLVYTAMPFKALQLGAGPFTLGAMAALSTGSYAVLVGLCGRWSDRLPRLQLARLSSLGIILGCIGMTVAPDLRWMLLVAPCIGGSMSPFWPSVQAHLADRTAAAQLERQLGRFNLSWTLGKASGFLVGGTVVAAFGSAVTFTLASCIAFVIFFLLPVEPRPSLLRGSVPAESGATEAVPAPATAGTKAAQLEVDPRASLFRPLAWVANGTAFGVGATLNHHYPRLIREFGWSPHVFGLFLGLVYMTQALVFIALTLRPERWRYRRAPLFAPQILMLFAMVSLPLASLPRVLASALVFGVALGSCYTASLYYSLHAPAARGRYAGVHEGLIGLGSMAIPFLGGLLARLLHGLWVPYVVAGAAVALSLVVQECLFRWAARRRPG
ncbi:MAG TPA: MFS transporter [Candidatus Krumholzibacteria bacterium]|nr:MFS transporter [Candidatus Krumholzibacteria bacterium]